MPRVLRTGGFNHLVLKPNSLSWVYGVAMPADWLPVLAPLIVAALAHWREARRQSRLLSVLGHAPAAQASVALLGALVLLNGCAASKAPRERGWIGGEYKLAKAGGPLTGPDVVRAFPRELKGVHSAGLLVTGLRRDTPAALGGVREGDLILKVDARPVGSLREFRQRIDAAAPGDIVRLTVFREGVEEEEQVVAGRETFTRSHWLGMGLMLSREWDLWPNPDFSLIALGYKHRPARTETNSPEAEYVRRTRVSNGEAGGTSSDLGGSWEVWLALFNVGGRDRIRSQEIVAR